jgi:flagellar hook-length control protein FliK
MQINNLGFPTGLLGAGGAAPDAGIGFAQTLGQVLGAPSQAIAGAGLTAAPAANDSVAPAATMSMAQLLTAAAPLAPPPALTPAGVTPAAVAPDAPVPAAPVPDAQPVVAEPADPAIAAALPANPAAVEPQAPQASGKPIVQGKPAKPGSESKPEPSLDLLADPAPEAPVADAPAEQPVEESKTETPVKRSPRIADDVAEDLPADPAANANAQPVAAELVAAAAVQAPVRPELAVRPQPSPTRQIGEVSGNARKADAGRAEPATAQPAATGDKAHAAVSAVAGKAGDKNDNAPSDERGQAPAFTLRQDAHAATPAHAATETSRTQAAPAIAAAEPVIAARPGHLGQQMGVEIARKVEGGDDTLRVRLSPDNLGKVEVTLSFDDAGTLRATVRADSAHALDLLRQDAPDLGRALDQAGIRADAQSFRFESRSEGGGAQGQQQQRQNSSGGPLAGNDEPDTTEIAYREIRSDGQVDLLA